VNPIEQANAVPNSLKPHQILLSAPIANLGTPMCFGGTSIALYLLYLPNIRKNVGT
jgi:hypothetical protein